MPSTAASKSRSGPYTRDRNVESSSCRMTTSNPAAASRACTICSSAASPLPTVSSSNRVACPPTAGDVEAGG